MYGRLAALAVVLALACVGCGIKAAPKPPLEATAVESSSPADAGCSSCAEKKP